VHEIDARERLQQLATHMIGRTGTCRGTVQLAGFGLGQRDELCRVFGGHAGVREQHLRIDRTQRYRRQIAKRIVGCFVKQRIEYQSGGRRKNQRVAIRVGFGCNLMRDYAARAGAIVDHHLLAPVVGKPLRNRARGKVIGTACGARHDDADGAVGVALCLGIVLCKCNSRTKNGGCDA
jgi:hypothetical protein